MANVLDSIGTLPATGSGPVLSEPPSERVVAGGSVAIGGSYADSFAQTNPGLLYLHITDGIGTLSATDELGNPVAGSGSNSIGISTTYANINAILASLQYTPGSATGSDTIRFEIWNQAGVDTTGSVPVTISDSGATTDRWIGSVSSDWNDAANWSTGAVPTTGDTVLIYGNNLHDPILSNATITGETIDLQGSGNSAPTVDFNDVTLDSLLQSGNAGQLHIGGTLTIGPNGTLLADPQATLSITGTAEAIVNNGSIISGSGGELLIYNQATTGGSDAILINHGSIAAQGGRIELGSFYDPITNPPGWNVLNSGTVSVTQGADLTLDGTLNGGTVAFNGSGSLTLEQAQAFAGGASLSGFGQGDAIHLIGPAWGTLTALNNGTLQVGAGGSIEAIPLAGAYSLGNFEDQAVGGVGNPSIIGYAPDGGPSGLVNPDIVAPASDSVAQGATLALDTVSVQCASGATTSNVTLGIDAGSGTLYINGASGSGTSHLSLGVTSLPQVNADLASLRYVPASGSTADTVSFNVAPSGQSYTIRSIPIRISGTAAPGPLLTEPASETVAAGGTVAVGGDYTDSLAAGNPGTMYLRVSDSIGTLRATDAAGNTVAGSGSNSITLVTDYNNINATLHSLTYAASANAGSDTISFDIWNQAGHETTGSVAVTVTGDGSGGQVLAEPSTVTASANGTVAVGGSYSDSFAQNNPGMLWLGISDSSGTLTSSDASGHTVAGSGSNGIGLSTDYVDLNAILANLHYTAGASTGSDMIQFDVWNQAGVETTGSTAVTIDPSSLTAAISQASSTMLTDLSKPAIGGVPALLPEHSQAAMPGTAMLNEIGKLAAGMPLPLLG